MGYTEIETKLHLMDVLVDKARSPSLVIEPIRCEDVCDVNIQEPRTKLIKFCIFFATTKQGTFHGKPDFCGKTVDA